MFAELAASLSRFRGVDVSDVPVRPSDRPKVGQGRKEEYTKFTEFELILFILLR